jgi:hypothetical protein
MLGKFCSTELPPPDPPQVVFQRKTVRTAGSEGELGRVLCQNPLGSPTRDNLKGTFFPQDQVGKKKKNPT